MKVLSALGALALCVGLSTSSYAQSSGLAIANDRDILLGPMFTIGGNVSTGDVATGWKTAASLGWTFGVMGQLPLSQAISFNLGLGYENRGLNYHNEANDQIGYNLSLNYFSIRPLFRFSSVYVGAGFGLPLSVKSTDIATDVSKDGKSSDLNTIIEARVGGLIPIMRSDLGELDLNIDAAYGFSRVMTDAAYVGTNVKENNGPMATVQIGATYFFDISRSAK